MAKSIDCIRNYEINNLEDYSGNYEVVLESWETDWMTKDWSTSTLLDVVTELERILPKGDVFKVLPTLGEFNFADLMSKEEAQWFESELADPKDCIELFKIHNVIKRADPLLHHRLEWLHEKWEEGFTVFVSD